jgi:hypothetical protein
MRDTLKLEQIKIENSYNFSLNFQWKLYKNLSIKIDNFKWILRILWITIDNRLEKLSNFKEIEQKIFKTIVKTFKKQTKNTTLALTF